MGTRHAGVLGRTQMGKSHLLKHFCRKATRAGRETLVYDITLSDEAVAACNAGNGEWEATYTTNDEAMFLQLFWAGHDLIVFVDEGGETAGRSKLDVKFTATRGSHQIGSLGAGSSIFFAAHSYADLNKTLRGQLSEFFICACSKESAVDLADEFDEPRLRKATKLEVGEFYHVGARVTFAKYRVNPDTDEIEPLDLEPAEADPEPQGEDEDEEAEK